MRAVVALLLCVAVAVSAQPKPGATKGGAPLQAKRASIKPNTVPRASPNQVCTALYGATTVTGTCWTADTCKRHAGQGLTAVTAQAPGNKCPAGQSCCVTGLKPLPPTPTAPVTPPPVKPPTTTPTAPSAPAPVKPPAPQQPPAPQAPQGVPQPQVPAAPQAPAALPKAAGFVDKCAAYTGKPGEKPSRYGCTRCVNSNDNNQLRCRYSTQSGTCYGSGYRYGEAAWAYERLLKERFVEYPGDCDRM